MIRHASDHIENWCLHQLTFIYDYRILPNFIQYFSVFNDCYSLENPMHYWTMDEHLKNEHLKNGPFSKSTLKKFNFRDKEKSIIRLNSVIVRER